MGKDPLFIIVLVSAVGLFLPVCAFMVCLACSSVAGFHHGGLGEEVQAAGGDRGSDQAFYRQCEGQCLNGGCHMVHAG